MDDKEIIALFFARSEQAIAELSNKYEKLCRKIAQNILGDALDAEECVNEGWLGVWRTIPPQTPDHLRSYVCRIVRNIAINRYHANTAAKRNHFYDVSLDELEDCLPSAASWEDGCTADVFTKALDDFLSHIDKNSRVMFVRRYFYSDSVTEIANRFGMSPNHVSVKLSRIRDKLRRHLQKEGIEI